MSNSKFMKGNGFVILVGIITGVVLIGIVVGIILFNNARLNKIYTPNLTVAEGEERIMLVDYCHKTVGTNGGDGYNETVLYYTKDGKCEVHYFSQYEYEGEMSHSIYEVDNKVIEDVYKILRELDMASWNEKYKNSKYVITGAAYVVKFRLNDGEYVRVTSDNMPEDGIRKAYNIAACLDEYANDGKETEAK
ncbi:MAG: hypothetical protein K5644_06875 [Lachnospiraceae bacterium]|nr:hypothetical protein [Lachnospiraceae bacterium]